MSASSGMLTVDVTLSPALLKGPRSVLCLVMVRLLHTKHGTGRRSVSLWASTSETKGTTTCVPQLSKSKER